jgi:hypothetical protein
MLDGTEVYMFSKAAVPVMRTESAAMNEAKIVDRILEVRRELNCDNSALGYIREGKKKRRPWCKQLDTSARSGSFIHFHFLPLGKEGFGFSRALEYRHVRLWEVWSFNRIICS